MYIQLLKMAKKKILSISFAYYRFLFSLSKFYFNFYLFPAIQKGCKAMFNFNRLYLFASDQKKLYFFCFFLGKMGQINFISMLGSFYKSFNSLQCFPYFSAKLGLEHILISSSITPFYRRFHCDSTDDRNAGSQLLLGDSPKTR